MTDSESAVLHVTFGESAAGSLLMALETLDRRDELIYLGDDLSLGPIDPCESRVRAAWMVDALGDEEDPELVSHCERFWNRIASQRGEIVAWISRRHAREYCGLLELVACAPTTVRVVDVADVEFAGRDGAPNPVTSMTFGFVGDAQIVSYGLLERAISVSSTARDAYLAQWRQLREENAALRIMTSTGLVSAPITYFDDTIISCATNDWQRCGRVVGDAVYTCSPGPFLQGGGDRFVFSRLLALMDEGRLEGRNGQELWSLQKSWVRRAEQRSRHGRGTG
jgi:hypothetical protein